MRVLILTFGTRGDVQPYTGLATALIAAGHSADICTHPIHKPFIEDFGVGFVAYPGPNPQKLFDWCVRVGIFSSKFMLEVSQLAHSFMSSWGQVCKDNIGKYDIIVDTFTTTHHGLTLAEASGIPACTIHYVPVGATSYYYSPYAPYGLRKTASGENYLNLLSHEIIDYFYGLLARRPMNKTRIELGLKPITGFSDWDLKLQTPRIYCHSPAYLPKPPDFPDQTRVVGYFWLPEKPFTPPEELVEFLAKGTPVYVGFGSVNVPGGKSLIVRLVEGVRMAGERVIVFTPEKNEAFLDDPDILYVKYQVPHAWLFPRVKLAIHHGGAGTVAYALKAGIPQIIMPFFGDHFLWAHRLQEMGCGPAAMPLKSTQPTELAAVLRQVLGDQAMLQKVRELSDQVNAEQGGQETVKLLENLHQYGAFPNDTAPKPELPVTRRALSLVEISALTMLFAVRTIAQAFSLPLAVLMAIKQPEQRHKAMVYDENKDHGSSNSSSSSGGGSKQQLYPPAPASGFAHRLSSFMKFPWY
eukprot:EG_transcript_2461